jgi:cell division protein FtsI/penicillin-binding protein 2
VSRAVRFAVRVTAAVAATALVLTGVAACGSDDEVERTLQRFLAGFASGTWEDVGFVSPTGSPLDPQVVAAEIATVAGELSEFPPQFEVGDVSVDDETATAEVGVAWPLADPAASPPVWRYETSVRLTGAGDDWRVVWEPAVIHPDLAAGDQLMVRRQPAERGDIVDRAGNALMTARDVVDVGIWPAQATDLDRDLAEVDAALRSIGVEIDMAELRDRIEAADPDHFVPVVTLRAGDYARIEDRIEPLSATTFRERQRHLAPTRTFARAVLGIVDEATAEVIEHNPGVYEVGDQVGYGGLSQRYDAQLRGTPGYTVVAVHAGSEGTESGSDDPEGEPAETPLYTVDPVPGTDLTVTLDVEVQEAAERALHSDPRRAALVAIRVSDGSILAAANTHGAEANPVDLALAGAVPPGSTFKMVTAYALLSAGEVELDTVVECPREATVEGRTFHNDGNVALGDIPFRTAVARSCNTAFVLLAPALGGDGLAAAAAELGIGGDWDPGLEAFTGQVGTDESPVERAAAAFGQGTTLVSPLAMAAAPAPGAGGRWLPPWLVVDGREAPTPVPLDREVVADLHSALREVVTDGTATALADVPGAPVHGKTGTAEAGDQTHGWFVGWQGDIAFAVCVEDGQSGSGSAVPLAERFLRELN